MTKPILMGGLMGPMMLWMLHGAMTGSGPTGWALVAFIAAHGVIAIVVIGAGIFAARLSPRAQRIIARLHRPSFRHLASMLLAAGATAALVHVYIHGGIWG